MSNLLLGIETSCDDTSLALAMGPEGPNGPKGPKEPEGHLLQILSHKTFSQETLLRKWGGVVPDIAARNHSEKIVPLLEEVFQESGTSPQDLKAIGVTVLPGLLGPLLTGLNVAKTLALYFEIPIVPVNHLFAHLEAIHLTQAVPYPYLGLLISGGHGAFFLVTSPVDFKLLGTTLDDAPGEAFDKGGKLMGLPYPAGKAIDLLAARGNAQRFSFPIGLKEVKNAQMSFSGLKTSLRVFLEKNPHLILQKSFEPTQLDKYPQELFDLCASYQEAITQALALKLHWAQKIAQEITGEATNNNQLPVVVGGGVACNRRIRTVLQQQQQQQQLGEKIFFVQPEFCTDNGAMVANYAFRAFHTAVPFPECLSLDAKGKYISTQTNSSGKGSSLVT